MRSRHKNIPSSRLEGEIEETFWKMDEHKGVDDAC